jgi:hypothetical protein
MNCVTCGGKIPLGHRIFCCNECAYHPVTPEIVAKLVKYWSNESSRGMVKIGFNGVVKRSVPLAI